MIDRTFVEVLGADSSCVPPALEIVIVPQIAVATLVHAPIGTSSEYAVPMGWETFDESVVVRTPPLATDRLWEFVREPDRHALFVPALQTMNIDGS